MKIKKARAAVHESLWKQFLERKRTAGIELMEKSVSILGFKANATRRLKARRSSNN